MDITCPSCNTRFRVERGQFGDGGRKLRCGSCGHVWRLRAGAPDAKPEPSAAADHSLPFEVGPAENEGVEALVANRSGAAKSGGGALAWLLLLALIAAIGLGGWYGRTAVVEKLPQAAKLYHLLGIELPPAVLALRIHDVALTRATIEGRAVLQIEGFVVNTSQRPVAAPPLVAVLSDAGGRELRRWRFTLAQAELAPGATVAFESQGEDLADAVSLSVDFVPMAVAAP
jgi:predicted Zn finger-like uncharacterized protein